MSPPKALKSAVYAIIEDSGTQIRVSQGDVIKFKYRNGYRSKTNHRQNFHPVKIDKIAGG